MNLRLFLFIQVLSICSARSAKEAKKETKIALFSTCLKTHRRTILSIAKELSLRPNVNVTVTIDRKCEDYVRQLGLNLHIEVIPSTVDTWELDESSLKKNKVYYAQLGHDWLDFYTKNWENISHPDVIVSEMFSHAALELSEIYNLPIVMVYSSLMTFEIFDGNELAFEYTSYASAKGNFEVSDNSFVRAFRYLYRKFEYFMFNRFLVKDRNEVREKFGLEPAPRVSSTNSEIPPFIISESIFGFEEPRLIPPNLELVGFLNTPENLEPLDSDIKAWMDNSKGFFYIATGSMQSLKDFQIEAFSNLFPSMKYDFLISSKVLVSDQPNVKIVKWINQVEVLNHPNVLAFASHGGFSSIFEAIQGAVPILCLPQDKDQFSNCDIVNRKHMGIRLKIEEANAEALKSVFEELVNNEVYKNTQKKFRAILKSHKGEKRAADLILSFAEFGYQHLIPRWYSLPWYKKNELDIFVIYGVVLWIVFLGLRSCFNRVTKFKTKVE